MFFFDIFEATSEKVWDSSRLQGHDRVSHLLRHSTAAFCSIVRWGQGDHLSVIRWHAFLMLKIMSWIPQVGVYAINRVIHWGNFEDAHICSNGSESSQAQMFWGSLIPRICGFKSLDSSLYAIAHSFSLLMRTHSSKQRLSSCLHLRCCFLARAWTIVMSLEISSSARRVIQVK